MSEYDEWKTDPDYGKSNKDLRIEELEAENIRLNERVKLLTDTLEEVLEECKDEYDVDPDPTGGHDDVPNRWMRLGAMIEETLYGPGVHW